MKKSQTSLYKSPLKAPKTRTLGGKKYKLQWTFVRRNEADKFASGKRGNNSFNGRLYTLARVVPVKGGWAVYTYEGKR